MHTYVIWPKEMWFEDVIAIGLSQLIASRRLSRFRELFSLRRANPVYQELRR